MRHTEFRVAHLFSIELRNSLIGSFSARRFYPLCPDERKRTSKESGDRDDDDAIEALMY